ncbi:leukotriene A-4 hydrolase [Arctopsyche grandis]|uniref:leukotriene A-4 hydrolase n=1 Tax=Arctopsyche grandis TaxID=121162 RepID=UPI00406D9F11
MALSPADPTSFSLPDQHVIKHIHLVWNVDFSRKIISGKAQLKVEKLNDTNKQLVLDVSLLTILNISLINGEVLNFKVDSEVKNIGSKLTIDLSESDHGCLDIIIQYESSPDATGLQWLDPLQTAGRKHPYMFSQFQPIHARSIVPCQDTPAVKFTYSAEVTASNEFTVLMSALRTGKKKSVDDTHNVFSFNQPVPIPAYLIAIAIGALESRELGPRSTIWAEKEIIDKSAWEFAETDKMLKIAEEVCGPYVWGIYDLLVLPPSFPYGGMENPCLTFVTPTVLAGDRSLADVVVHEITHSWTGNLVTNRNFEHFWLNEGFTVFIERKISSRLYGEALNDTRFRDFSTILGLEELRDAIFGHLGTENPLTNLIVDLKGLSPDDAFSTVPYEKGSTFLRYLENLLGGPEKFEPFLRHYLKTFAKKSIDTDDFKNLLLEYFKDNKALDEIQWDEWLKTPGMPLIIPKYDTTMVEACTELAKRWLSPDANYTTFNLSDYQTLTSMQQRQFLSELLKENVSLDMVKALQDVYKINSSNNSEIKFRWLRLCIKARWSDKIKDALQFANEQGRMKFVRPIYRDLYAWDEARSETLDNFNNHKSFMMYLTSHTIKKDLHLDN